MIRPGAAGDGVRPEISGRRASTASANARRTALRRRVAHHQAAGRGALQAFRYLLPTAC